VKFDTEFDRSIPSYAEGEIELNCKMKDILTIQDLYSRIRRTILEFLQENTNLMILHRSFCHDDFSFSKNNVNLGFFSNFGMKIFANLDFVTDYSSQGIVFEKNDNPFPNISHHFFTRILVLQIRKTTIPMNEMAEFFEKSGKGCVLMENWTNRNEESTHSYKIYLLNRKQYVPFSNRYFEKIHSIYNSYEYILPFEFPGKKLIFDKEKFEDMHFEYIDLPVTTEEKLKKMKNSIAPKCKFIDLNIFRQILYDDFLQEKYEYTPRIVLVSGELTNI